MKCVARYALVVCAVGAVLLVGGLLYVGYDFMALHGGNTAASQHGVQWRTHHGHDEDTRDHQAMQHVSAKEFKRLSRLRQEQEERERAQRERQGGRGSPTHIAHIDVSDLVQLPPGGAPAPQHDPPLGVTLWFKQELAQYALALPTSIETNEKQQGDSPAQQLHEHASRCGQGFFVDKVTLECKRCPANHFTLPPRVLSCQRFLACDEIADLMASAVPLSQGGVKTLYKTAWKGIPVVVATPKSVPDMRMGYENLRLISPHAHVTQVLGVCMSPFTLVFPFYSRGDALRTNAIASGIENALDFRMQLVQDFTDILVYLHHDATGGKGAFVMCDAVTAEKLLSQFMISNDLRLILNDVDALPLAFGKTVKCGHQELRGDYVAPEQRWHRKNMPFRDDLMPPYDEKVDIWRIPEAIEHLLDCEYVSIGGSGEAVGKAHAHCEHAMPFLATLRAMCKRKLPEDRAAALDVQKQVSRMVAFLKRSASFPIHKPPCATVTAGPV